MAELEAKIACVRDRIAELPAGEVPYRLGAPVAPESAASLPVSLRGLYGLFDGLSADQLVIGSAATVSVALAGRTADGDLFDPAPGKLEFGGVLRGAVLCVDEADGTVHLLREDRYMAALEAFEPLRTTPLAADPVAFADRFLFGAEYAALIEAAGGYLSPGDRVRDGWRRLLEGLGFAQSVGGSPR
ncbi:hypothetical protein [Glycomyces paridis]|uniref:SUKH-4 immunity protein of toxin-antitoxin system n=1 Tax=Glycomyces paridis TaxID=2126555 RepID=A0A4S8P968_9ACTN|nr:hypothetical protein [Glycomyces paridis]THV26780.1 hypothetical protein E9998_17500 [Glycomyces paridis]